MTGIRTDLLPKVIAPKSPVVRAGNLVTIIAKLRTLGITLTRYLDQAGIPEHIIETPEALISLPRSARFLELVARAEGIPDLGLQSGQATSIADLGPYGKILDRSITVYDYLRLGVPLYDAVSNAHSFWLESHGEEIRLRQAYSLEPSLGTTQSDLNGIAIVLRKFREALGPNWTPTKVALAWECDDLLPSMPALGGMEVITGTGQTYIEFRREDLRARFPGSKTNLHALRLVSSDVLEPIPNSLIDLVAMQIERVAAYNSPSIHFLAETLGLPVRTLQYHLTQSGLSYRELLSEARFRIAAHYLENSNEPIAQIAAKLGYSEASSFIRAFHKMSGVSPRGYRQAALADR